MRRPVVRPPSARGVAAFGKLKAYKMPPHSHIIVPGDSTIVFNLFRSKPSLFGLLCPNGWITFRNNQLLFATLEAFLFQLDWSTSQCSSNTQKSNIRKSQHSVLRHRPRRWASITGVDVETARGGEGERGDGGGRTLPRRGHPSLSPPVQWADV